MKRARVLAALLTAATLAPLDLAAQMPASQVILENASVRVALLTFVPGGATGRHQSIESEIGIVLEGELTVESPTGRQKLGPGNEGGRPAKLWDIFLKRCD
jgi:quercetin dioxygenase-like cupin family protein